jgi:hypothetical protein
MKIKPYRRYTGGWVLTTFDNSRVACAKEFYTSEAEAQNDIPRVIADLKIARQKAIDDILAELENENE